MQLMDLEGNKMHISFANTKLHKIFVERNKYVQDEYENYIRVNSKQGKRNRGAEWLFLARANLAYLILNRRTNNKDVNKANESIISESGLYNKILPQHYIKELLQYDVVSFDIFDTLIFRPFNSPKTLFDLLEAENKIEHFSLFRVKAEEEVRKESKEQYGTREIKLIDIYKYIERYTGLNCEQGMKSEIEKELEFCYANPFMQAVYNMLIAAGKRIIIVSDMYLNKDIISKILEKNNYKGYEKLYVSCEYKCSKATGELYDLIRNELGAELSYIHVGDNTHSDINMAQNAGWKSKRYYNVNEVGKRHRADGISKIIKSTYAGIVNTHLHNGMNVYTPAYEYGFINGGLYCLGYVMWIHEYAIAHDIDKVIFLARDGDIYKNIYDKLFEDIPSEYMYWSRISTIKYNVEKNRYDFLRRMALYPILNKSEFTLKEILESVDLQVLEERLEAYGLHNADILTEENRKQFEDFLIDCMPIITQIYQESELNAKKYVKSVIGNAGKIVFVDIGWAGSGPLSLKHIIEEKWKWDCKAECLLAATGDNGTAKLLKKDINIYMFSSNMNRIHYDSHFSLKNRGVSNDLIELLTQATIPSFSGFGKEERLTMEFSTPCVEGYKLINEFHQGIKDFVYEYIKHFGKYEYLLNISGYDAYCAYRIVLRNKRYFSNNFGEFPCESNTGKMKKIVTLKQYLEDKGVS